MNNYYQDIMQDAVSDAIVDVMGPTLVDASSDLEDLCTMVGTRAAMGAMKTLPAWFLDPKNQDSDDAKDTAVWAAGYAAAAVKLQEFLP